MWSPFAVTSSQDERDYVASVAMSVTVAAVTISLALASAWTAFLLAWSPGWFFAASLVGVGLMARWLTT